MNKPFYIDKKKIKSERTSTATPLKEAFENMFRRFKLDSKFNEIAVIEAWPDLMGQLTASYTQRLFIKDKKLFVQLSSAPLKQQLFLQRTKIIELISEKVSEGIVNEIVFL